VTALPASIKFPARQPRQNLPISSNFSIAMTLPADKQGESRLWISDLGSSTWTSPHGSLAFRTVRLGTRHEQRLLLPFPLRLLRRPWIVRRFLLRMLLPA